MRTFILQLLLVATPAAAHIKLLAPESFQVTDGFGSPQKVGPCGEDGTPSNVVTTVVAGQTLTVTWQETIFHPGHFRLSIDADPERFITPTPVLDSNGMNCASAPIDRAPQLPTVADGVFVHTTSSRGPYSTQLTVPMISCERCTLQLMQFMASHAPPCFYYQCATLRIVLPDAGVNVPDGGLVALEDGGVLEPAAPVGCGCTSTSAWGSSWLLPAFLLLWRRRSPR